MCSSAGVTCPVLGCKNFQKESNTTYGRSDIPIVRLNPSEFFYQRRAQEKLRNLIG
jgi:hypothetical protein